MKLLCYADLHATDGSELCFQNPNITLQHYRILKFFDDIKNIYTKYKCDGIIDLGDTTSDRSALPMTTLDILGECMSKLPKGVHWKITGNHEQYLRNTTISNKQLFKFYFKKVIDTVHIEPLEDCTLFFAAYHDKIEDIIQWLMGQSLKYKSPRILFGHLQIEGACGISNKILTGIPQEALKNFDLVILGHIHLPQSLSPAIHYVGAPFQQNWGETGHKKRVGIVDTSTATIKWVYLEGYPEYKQVTFEEFKKLAETPSEDRYRVVLNSPDEAAQFFLHPQVTKAVAVYNYTETGQAQEAQENYDWTFEGACLRYMQIVPPEKYGITLDIQKMMQVIPFIIQS